MKRYILSKEEEEEIEENNNIFSFEEYCGQCIYFDTEECPFKDKVFSNTKYKNIKCSKFFD